MAERGYSQRRACGLMTNATQLSRYAEELAVLGVRRVNVLLDTFDPDKFTMITRGGLLVRVLEGIAAAQAAGLAVKLNAVALKGFTEDGIDDLIGFAHAGGMTLTLIETMPLGETGADRTDQFLPLSRFVARSSSPGRWSIWPSEPVDRRATSA
jgi:GTP 3',8-cyclase